MGSAGASGEDVRPLAKSPDDPFAGTRMTLGEHLQELRLRLWRGVVAIAVAFVLAWIFQDHLRDAAIGPYERAMDMLEQHYREQAEAKLAADPSLKRTEYFVTDDPSDRELRHFDRRFSAIGVTEPFVFLLKLCFYAALVVGGPILLWQMWGFIAAGLYPRERGLVTRYFPFSVGAFAAGVAFGYFLVIPFGIYFLNLMIPIELVRPAITLDSYTGFLLTLCVAFGFVFQLPLLMTFLARVGLVTPAWMAQHRGHFVVVAFITAALLTPTPDAYTQCMMAVPLCLLYEIGLLTSRRAARRREPVRAEAAR
jgi:sec-independent protein translocase protein TatC